MDPEPLRLMPRLDPPEPELDVDERMARDLETIAAELGRIRDALGAVIALLVIIGIAGALTAGAVL